MRLLVMFICSLVTGFEKPLDRLAQFLSHSVLFPLFASYFVFGFDSVCACVCVCVHIYTYTHKLTRSLSLSPLFLHFLGHLNFWTAGSCRKATGPSKHAPSRPAAPTRTVRLGQAPVDIFSIGKINIDRCH